MQLAGVTDVNRAPRPDRQDRAARVLRPRGRPGAAVDFAGFPIPNERLYDLLAGQQSSIQEGGGKESTRLRREVEEGRRRPLPDEGGARRTARSSGRAARTSEVMGVPKNRIVITCTAKSAVVCPPGASTPVPGVDLLLPLQVPAGELGEADSRDEGRRPQALGDAQDFDTNSGQPIVLMQFTKDGTDKFGDITRELAQRGKRVSFGGQDQFQHFAIVLDNEIRSWPRSTTTRTRTASPARTARRSPAWPG